MQRAGVRKRLGGGGESSGRAAGFGGTSCGAFAAAGSECVERLGNTKRLGNTIRAAGREEALLGRVMSDSLRD